MANGTLKVSNIETSSGSGTITIGQSGETVDLSNGTVTGITTGKILQAVTNTHATRFTTTSTSFVAATGYTVAITPSATSSKIFVIASSMVDTGASGRVGYATLYRDSTNLGDSEGIGAVYSDSGRAYAPITMSVLDSPSTTSAITYQVYWRTNGGSVVFNDTEGEAQLTAFEVSG